MNATSASVIILGVAVIILGASLILHVRRWHR